MSARSPDPAPRAAVPPPVRPPLALVFAVTVTGIMANTLLNPLIPDVLDGLAVSSGAAGILVASGALPGVFLAPVIGIAADRYGRRAVLVPSLLAFGVFGLLAGVSPSFWVLIVFRLAQGVGGAALINLAVVIISDHWDGLDRARVLGWNSAVLTVSLALLPPLGGLLGQLGGWRLAFAPYVVGILTALAVARWLPPARPTGPVPTLGEQLRSSLAAVRRPRVLATVLLGFLAFVLIFGLLLTALPLRLEDRFGLGAAARGVVLAVPALTSTLAALLLGRLVGRFGRRTLVTAAWFLFAAALAAIGGAEALVVVVVAALAYGAGEGLLIPLLQDTVAGAAPPERRGAVIAVFVSGVRAGQTVGPLLVGVALALAGAGTAFAIGAVAAGVVAGGLVLVGVRHRSDRPS